MQTTYAENDMNHVRYDYLKPSSYALISGIMIVLPPRVGFLTVSESLEYGKTLYHSKACVSAMSSSFGVTVETDSSMFWSASACPSPADSEAPVSHLAS